MLRVLMLFPLTQKKATHLRLQQESADARQACLNEGRSAFWRRSMGDPAL
jgi:hypothetical protein